jgi:predicted porin
MKKSLIALAVLGFAGVASAQSSVTMYGRVDLSIGKPIGTANKGMFNGSGSRLGMRGSEDLGGGLKGIFNIETRFDADTGAAQNFGLTTVNPAGAAGTANRFWGARSIVGVAGGFGEITLGREYTTSFLQSQLQGDPWGWDTVAAQNTITGGLIGTVRNDSAITYKSPSFGGFGFQFQTAERTDTFVNRIKRPVNLALVYAAGPVFVGFGHEVVGTNAKWTTLAANVKFGAFKPGVFLGSGNTAANAKHRSVALTAAVSLGAGELRAFAGTLKNKTAGVTAASNFALGYHHSLSKRTTVYVDFARNGKATTQKTGYDFGLKHNF